MKFEYKISFLFFFLFFFFPAKALLKRIGGIKPLKPFPEENKSN